MRFFRTISSQGDPMFEHIKRPYKERSAAAHGEDKQEPTDHVAARSRGLLGQCLAAAVRLVHAGKLPVGKKKSLPECIQDYVFRRATRSGLVQEV